ncbi:toxin-antitoxin system [Enterococcus sp. 669A]|uniref:Toxin-antitoxin system n=1 Tax=Candidatus Enterococcus moelleringii TaxID=2815325 RepID=A0ABS3LGS1_9ENTE|nr:toxin-antitoxin system [Enterococcus sp. 669A]MBO1308825.1 toxin-antitoxin system [Enterococcus sp. 669A]
MKIKTRKQGNSITVTVPKEFNIDEDMTMEAKLFPTGIFYEFIKSEDDFLDFDTEVLHELVSQGVTGEDLVNKFSQRKKEVSKALQKLSVETMSEPIMTRTELEKEINKECSPQ